MTRHPRIRLLIVLFCLISPAAGCRADDTAETAVPPGAERRGVPGRVTGEGYAPDELAWFREGRPVEFGGREWRPVGHPIEQERGSFVRVGEFEGMGLYAAVGDEPPYEHLFFPLGGDVWQTLDPASGAGDDEGSGVPGPSDQSPRRTGTGRSPE